MASCNYIYPAGKGSLPLISCQTCRLKCCCLPAGLDAIELTKLEGIIKRHHPLQKGEHLFRAEDPMRYLYAVRSGAMKTYYLTPEGNEQIADFHLAGEIVALDAIGKDLYRNNCVALDTTVICSISLRHLEDLISQVPRMRHRVLNVLSRKIHQEHQHHNNYRQRAEQRLAAFMLNLSARYNKVGFSANQFNLPMSRSDIANYLGLSNETVSRLLSAYKQQGLIKCDGRDLQLLNMSRLHTILENSSEPDSSYRSASLSQYTAPRSVLSE